MLNNFSVHEVLSKSFLFTLSIGIICGFSFAFLIINVQKISPKYSMFGSRDYYDSFLNKYDGSDESGINASIGVHGENEEFSKKQHSIAEKLRKEVRVLCWVMTNPTNHAKKAIHVKATWGKRCNTLLFMSTTKDSSLPTIKLENVKEGRDFLWAKTKAAFKYIYEHHFNDADWFLKADDDTYVIVENLRYMLQNRNASAPIYFGCRFNKFTKQGYMSGGAGYVLSKEAVKRFVTRGIPDKTGVICRKDGGGSEDVEIGKCLENVGVLAQDSRDAFGRGRFFPFVPEHHLIPGITKGSWYWSYIYYPSKEGSECCSDSAVSFHYVSPNLMYVLEYLIYHLRPYGIDSEVLPVTPSKSAVSSSSVS